jgi:hypothetical protein
MPLYLSSAKWCIDSDGGSENLIKKNPSETGNAGTDPEDKKNRLDEKYQENEDTPKRSGNENAPEKDSNKAVSDGVKVSNGVENFSDEIWKRVLTIIRSRNASTEALLRASKPISFDGRKLQLAVFYKFHKEKLESVPHKICLEDSLRGVVGTDVVVECFLTSPEKTISDSGETNVSSTPYQNEGNYIKTKNGEVVLAETEDLDLSKLADEIFGN